MDPKGTSRNSNVALSRPSSASSESTYSQTRFLFSWHRSVLFCSVFLLPPSIQHKEKLKNSLMSLKGVFIATNPKRTNIDLYFSEFNTVNTVCTIKSGFNSFVFLKIVPAFLAGLAQSHRIKNYLV